MATIQIREIPEDTYETLRRLARADGKSLQSFMRDLMIDLATQTDKAAGFAEIEAMLAKHPHVNVGTAGILAHIDAGRGERDGR